jgi:hypothetical protein
LSSAVNWSEYPSMRKYLPVRSMGAGGTHKGLRNWPRNIGGVAVLALGLLVSGGRCGGDGIPDSGYGANQPVPAMVNCLDICHRASDCAAHLCDEDKHTTAYLALAPQLEAVCVSSCSDATLSPAITATQWQCVFHDSCRQVFGEKACGTANTYYTCN